METQLTLTYLGVFGYIFANLWTLLTFFFIFVVVMKTAVVVQEGCVVLTQLFGKKYRVLRPGLHLLLPFVESQKRVHWTHVVEGYSGERIVRRQQLVQLPSPTEQLYDISPINVILHDSKRAIVNAVFTYVILDPVQAVYGIQDLPLSLEMLVQAKLHSTCSELTFDQISRDRYIVQKQVMQKFVNDTSLDSWGVRVCSLELQSIDLAKDMRDAFEERQKAEMKRSAEMERARSDAERMIQAQEAESKAAVIKAKGEYDRIVLKAQKESEAKQLEARAKADAEAMASEAAAQGLKAKIDSGFTAEQVLELERINAQNNVARGLLASAHSPSAKMVIVPYDLAGLYSSSALSGASVAQGMGIGIAQSAGTEENEGGNEGERRGGRRAKART